MNLYDELRRVHAEMAKIQARDPATCDPPFKGWMLWAVDYYSEEAIILELLEKQMEKPNERQIGGDHYREFDPQYQHWDLVAEYGLSYFMGVMTKYVCRWRRKGGVTDLHKALHYVEKLISLEKEGNWVYNGGKKGPLDNAKKFCDSHKLSDLEREIVFLSISCYKKSELLILHAKLADLITEAEASFK